MIASLSGRLRGSVRPAAIACALLAALAVPARAQSKPARTPGPNDRIPNTDVRESELPLRFALPGPPPLVRQVQRAAPPLDPAHILRLRRAADLRAGGLPARALDSLRALDREIPHHPLIVGEMAATMVGTGDDRGAAALLERERAATHDSLLGSRDLAGALERLARPRDAAGVAIETWIAAPAEAPWASGLLLRLAPLDPRGITEALREAHARAPQRGDLVRGLAFVLARQGQPTEAVRVLATSERPPFRARARRLFADEALLTGVAPDSVAAEAALSSAAADTAVDVPTRLDAARRVLDMAATLGRGDEAAARMAGALAGVPAARWNPDLLLTIARGLRSGGHGAQAAELIGSAGAVPGRAPELVLERALGLAREYPERAVPVLDSLAKTWPPARFPLAEAQFWSGQTDSALANYRRASDDTSSPDAMSALDRTYLIEESPGSAELRALGAIAWARWRGDGARWRAGADSLWHALPLSSHYYAAAALESFDAHAAAADWRAALAPLTAITDSLPGDRLAPLAGQRAGETWLRLGDDRHALATFEDCLARYPKAWNSPEVRRQVERLRKERHL